MRPRRRQRPRKRRRGRYVFLLLVLLPFLVLGGISGRNHIRPRGIVLHHSALGSPAADARADAAALDALHARRGWGAFYLGRTYHIGYHYVVLPDGTIEPGRPERCRGAHTRGFNDYIGICIVGNFNAAAPTSRQQKALETLCRRLLRRYDWDVEDIRRHRDCGAATDCPGDRFPLTPLRDRLRRAETSPIRTGNR